MEKNNEIGQTEGHSRLGHVVENNIRTIIKHREKAMHRRTLQERIADLITDFSGSLWFVYIHLIWFGSWFLINTGWLGIKPFDPFPYGLLTMVVSLEAIFLSAFVLISQNRMSQEDEERAELDLQINLLTERELTRVLRMLDEIQDQLGMPRKSDQELAELKKETKPEEVLKEIERKESKTKKQSSV